MRKLLAMILALVLTAGCALAEGPKAPDYILEGFDGENSGVIWETNLFFTRMQEKTGISFQFRQEATADGWTNRKKEIARGENLPDVLFKAELTTEETAQMAKDGILVDLKPYLEQYAPDLWAILQANPEYLAAITLPDGKIVALPAFNRLQNNDLMWINRTWLNRLQLKTPTTADELTEVLRAFKTQDPNGQNGADEIPLAFIGMWELRFLGHAFGIIDNDYYMAVEDGNVVSHLDSEQNRAFLSWLHTLWDEKLLDQNGFSIADALRQITDDKKAIPYGMIMGPTPLTTIPVSALGQYDILMPLKADGKQVYRDLPGDLIPGTFAITSACREPEKLVAWVNILYTREGSSMAQYGLEGEEYSWREDGLWEWNEDLNTVANYILKEKTISGGTAAPGIELEDFQLKYSDEATRRNIEMMADAKQYSVKPFPVVVPDEEDAAEIARIQKELGRYAEKTMACFVTGDIPLDDENWKAFCDRVHELGLDDAKAIWQKYVTKGNE